MTPDALVREFRRLRVVDISDACDGNGLFHQAMDARMRPLTEGLFAVGAEDACLCGLAYTVKQIVDMERPDRETPCADWEDYQSRIAPPGVGAKYAEMDRQVRDRIVVTDIGGAPLGYWGSDTSLALKNAGCLGIVIDGGIRDSQEMRMEGIRIWSTVRTCRHLWPRLRATDDPTELNGLPIRCAGVDVRTADIVCADDDGVVVVPIERAERILAFAKRSLAHDQATRRKRYEQAGLADDGTLGGNRSPDG